MVKNALIFGDFTPVTLRACTLIASDILELVFEKPANFTYTPGQFVQFKIPSSNSFVLRTYSIASHPSENVLRFLVKKLPGGAAAPYFKKMQTGESAEVTAPSGHFILRPRLDAANIFIATGTGLAPVRSLVLESLQKNIPTKLLFGVRSEADIFWQEDLLALVKQFKNFSYVLTLSQPAGDWTGARGRVTTHVPGLMSPRADYYVCGSLPMVKNMRQLLLQQQVVTKKIYFEIF